MSGHSKWAKIKRAKGANDAKRGALFTKLARYITLAAQEGGGDPDMNFTLRLAIDKAKQANMPSDNIDRAIKKGTGEDKSGGQITRITYEFVASDGVAGLVDCATDNTNRTYSEVKNMIETQGHKTAEAGAVSWQFQEVGEIELGAAKLQKSEKFGEDDKYISTGIEELEMALLEVEGVLDYEVVDPSEDSNFEADETRPADRKYVFVKTEKEQLAKVSEAFSKLGWQVLDSSIAKIADNKVSIDKSKRERIENLIELLEDHDDVDTVWTNLAD